MKKKLATLIIVCLVLSSCKEEKKYSDYKKDDFYEVQGIVTHAPPTDDPFDLSVAKDVHYEYFINREKPLKGIEENLEILENINGYPVVILVHKDNETINFYSRIGITENLTMDEKKVLEKHFQEQMDIEKKKINKGI